MNIKRLNSLSRDKKLFIPLLLLLFSSLLLISCGGSSVECSDLSFSAPPVEAVSDASNDHITIINDDVELDKLVNCMSDAVPIDNGGKAVKAVTKDFKGKWGKGFSLTLVAEVDSPTIVGKAIANGFFTPDDMTSDGTYTGTAVVVNYWVQIDSTGGVTDTFKWSDDGGTTWNATLVPITGGAQALNNGVTVTFTGLTGHSSGDAWLVDAGILQATSVITKGKSSVVSYSMIGSPYLGAIQVFRNYSGFPVLRSQALFRDADINSVTISDGTLYAVGATNLSSPAFLETLGFSGSRLVLTGNNRVGLASFAGTSAIHNKDNAKVYITSGSAGELAILDDTNLIQDSADPATTLTDARWVDFEKNTSTLVVMRGGTFTGTNGQISVFDMSLASLSAPTTFPITGADIAQSKSTVEVIGGKAVIGAGSGGAQVIDTIGGSVLASIANPTVAGLAPDVVVANAVSVDNDLIFISNGEAGVYVAQADEDLDKSGSNGPVTLTLLGHLQFGNLQSVNHVAFKKKYLFVAAGLGGLKIVRVNVD